MTKAKFHLTVQITKNIEKMSIDDEPSVHEEHEELDKLIDSLYISQRPNQLHKILDLLSENQKYPRTLEVMSIIKQLLDESESVNACISPYGLLM